MDPRLLSCIWLARAGHRRAALRRLRDHIAACPHDADAWWVLGCLAPETDLRRGALLRALELAPGHELATRSLAELDATPAPLPEPPSPPEPVPPAFDFAAMREARALLWPYHLRGGHPRPLGALIDERRVTRQDLLWAVEHADAAEVREAARAILATVHRLPNVPLSLEDAQLIAWPFRHLNRPLGPLVRAGTVSVADLEKAAWTAEDARLREAARVLLPIARQLAGVEPEPVQAEPARSEEPLSIAAVRPGDTPRPSTRPMPVIQGSNYLVDEMRLRDRQQAIIAAVAVGLLVIGGGGLVYVAVYGVMQRTGPPLWVWPLLVVTGLALDWTLGRMTELAQAVRDFRRSQLAEIWVARALRQGLGGDWVLFRNVQVPQNDGVPQSGNEVDMVLLGPPGVFALAVCACDGQYRYRRERVSRRAIIGWRKLHRDPGQQAQSMARLVHGYIANMLNRDVPVKPHLVWAGPGGLSLESPSVPVWFLDDLDAETARLRALPATLSEADHAALAGLLRGLCSALH